MLFRSIVKGGRYDRLLQQFGKSAPAVGFVMVIDSIMEALARQNVELPISNNVERIVYSQNDFQEKLAEARRLRAQGIPVTLEQCQSL